MFFDAITNAERNRMEVVLRDLRGQPQAAELLRRIDERGGICLEAQPELLEARVAHALLQTGEHVTYEHGAGEGGTTVDFRTEGPPEIFLEVASLRSSEGVKAAHQQRGHFTEFSLSSRNLADPERAKESIEGEVIILQSKLGEKAFAKGQGVKFPGAVTGRYHVILMDVRQLFGGGEDMGSLLSELRLACFGYSDVDDYEGYEIRIGASAPDGSGGIQRLLGVFEEGDHPLQAVAYLRSRIHAIHFVCETRYEDGELAGETSPPSIAVFANPHLLQTVEAHAAFRAAYPLVRTRD